MAKKPTPKPIYDLKSDFIASLENVLTAASILRGAVKMALDAGAIDEHVAGLIRDKLHALDMAMSGD